MKWKVAWGYYPWLHFKCSAKTIFNLRTSSMTNMAFYFVIEVHLTGRVEGERHAIMHVQMYKGSDQPTWYLVIAHLPDF